VNVNRINRKIGDKFCLPLRLTNRFLPLFIERLISKMFPEKRKLIFATLICRPVVYTDKAVDFDSGLKTAIFFYFIDGQTPQNRLFQIVRSLQATFLQVQIRRKDRYFLPLSDSTSVSQYFWQTVSEKIPEVLRSKWR
jgi:hypothetical protein